MLWLVSLTAPVEKYPEQGGAIMAWNTPTDQGFDFKTLGENRRMPVDFDGVSLVRYCPKTNLKH